MSNEKIQCLACLGRLSDELEDDDTTLFIPCTLAPCGHFVCLECSKRLREKVCPECRQSIVLVVPLLQLVSDNDAAVEAIKAWRVSSDAPPPPEVAEEYDSSIDDESVAHQASFEQMRTRFIEHYAESDPQLAHDLSFARSAEQLGEVMERRYISFPPSAAPPHTPSFSLYRQAPDSVEGESEEEDEEEEDLIEIVPLAEAVRRRALESLQVHFPARQTSSSSLHPRMNALEIRLALEWLRASNDDVLAAAGTPIQRHARSEGRVSLT